MNWDQIKGNRKTAMSIGTDEGSSWTSENSRNSSEIPPGGDADRSELRTCRTLATRTRRRSRFWFAINGYPSIRICEVGCGRESYVEPFVWKNRWRAAALER